VTTNGNRPRVIRLNLDDPATMERMLRNGTVWRFTQFWQDAVNAIERGVVPLSECLNVPPEVVKALRT
jgi:hypothetical protein